MLFSTNVNINITKIKISKNLKLLFNAFEKKSCKIKLCKVSETLKIYKKSLGLIFIFQTFEPEINQNFN